MKKISIYLFVAFIVSGCGLKYESFVEGDSPEPAVAKVAVEDLLDAFDRSDVAGEMIAIHPAKDDDVVSPLIEERLRASGYMVKIIKPEPKLRVSTKEPGAKDLDDEVIPMSYKASFMDGEGTLLSLIHI